MNVYSRPIVFLVLAIVVISVGTLVTTFIPLFAKTTSTPIDGIKPYTALELAGRDIYVREGCNNCHTQTVRPLKFETDRYGDYSRGGEFVYDRPFLWGSKRTGPDLAREGGRYPDAWHYQHFKDPRALVPDSNMPAYGWLEDTQVDPAVAEKKMAALGFPYTADEITALNGKTEMDAMVAYMQKLGRDFKEIMAAKNAQAAMPASALSNPYAGNKSAIEEGDDIFEVNCASCHGKDLKGGIGADLTAASLKFGGTDADLYASITGGRPGGMPPFKDALGDDKVWRVVSFIQYVRGGGEEAKEAGHGGHH
ncbi:MAG: cytochrome-c oxidase, cbb3-type subunit II [Nitrospirae bacterium]|nr:cytochrome-c oxidase, cbb3-type subunit II [Nitrospirota bacterium]